MASSALSSHEKSEQDFEWALRNGEQQMEGLFPTITSPLDVRDKLLTSWLPILDHIPVVLQRDISIV